ncbi:MAG: tetratricopeptide repeat protein [Myxococcales bacterium]|nr:tetratricopeptide repeat protein [Myxococcales bacterium]MCB9645849.1 tetratricopeptide repeat protein [Deltaproteobacteria bacterium]
MHQMSAGDTESPSGEAQGAERGGPSSGNGAADNASRHASITELELQFAQNPESSAYIDLCEAYMDQGRFMEAMVVCKKGIKAHPDSVEAKILLARVYARQKKYKRALTELDALAASSADVSQVFLSRGKVRLDSGDDAGAVEDLKRAVDLDPTAKEASSLLAGKGIVYPEPEPEPEPPPQVMVTPVGQGMVDTMDLPDRGMSRGPSVVGAPPMSAPPRAGSALTAPPRFASQVPGAAQPYSMRPQRLEGEDELERLAQKVAEERPPRGRPKTTLILIAVLLVASAVVVGQRLFHKYKVENIDRLTTLALPLFNRDTYGGYKQSASLFEEIIEDYDGKHPLTLGRLAYVYAILWGEHGEKDLKPKLDEILARAERYAPEVSHTVAARGLATLYAGSGKEREAAARSAVGIVEPLVRMAKDGGAAPTHADLTLGIIELALGEYDAATKRLGNVKEVLPGSVRAKVWHARAAFLAGRLATAISAYSGALRAEPQHSGALAGLALARLRRGDMNGAATDLARFDEVAKDHPKDVSRRDNALAEFTRSEIMLASGEEAKATGAYELAVRLDPENPDFPYGLGHWLLENDRAKEALEPLRAAVKMDPNRWAFAVELAEAEMHVGNYDVAEKLVEDTLKTAGDEFQVHLAKGRLMRRKNRPGTVEFLNGMLEKWPASKVDVHLELGRYYRSEEKLDLARQQLEKAIEAMERAPRLKQADVLLSYGRLMEDQGQDGVALESFKQAASLGAMEGWYRSSIALAKTGDRGEAKKACERYLAAGTSLRYSKPAQRLCDSL